MPRSPTVFSLVPGTVPQVPDTPISSAMFNAAMLDFEQTFNTPQPIQYGGTAATTAVGGFDSLNTKGANVATAATLNLDTATGAFVDLTGITTVTAVTLSDGRHRMARATSVFQITVGASLIGNAGGSNINVEVGDLIIFEGYSAGVVRFWVIRASGSSVVTNTLFHAVDEKPTGTVGGSATIGPNVRTLNTVKTNEISGASLASNEVTLPSGTYWIECNATSLFPARTVLYLVSSAAPTTSILSGISDYSTPTSTDGDVVKVVSVSGRLVLASTTVLQLRQVFNSIAGATRSYGVEANIVGIPEKYAEFKVWKLK